MRHIEGFPIARDEDIINLSDPPYYTACPNPFIEDFIKEHRGGLGFCPYPLKAASRVCGEGRQSGGHCRAVELPPLYDRMVAFHIQRGVTSDQGNIAATGKGRLLDGILAETRGERARIYDNEAFRRQVQEKVENALPWPGFGLPADCFVLLASGWAAFVSEGKEIVSHGGISLEEVIVPFHLHIPVVAIRQSKQLEIQRQGLDLDIVVIRQFLGLTNSLSCL